MNTKTKIRKLIGKRIKQLRKSEGLTQEQLAEKASLSSKYLSRVELGKENPTLNVLIKLSSGLKVDLLEFFNIQHIEGSEKKLLKNIHDLIQDTEVKQLQTILRLIKVTLH